MQAPFAHTVLVVQRRLPHYRVPFFEALREQLAEQNCLLRLAYGTPTPEERLKNDSADLPWAERLPTRYLLRGKICWQPFGRQLNGADLVVMTAENKLVYNLFVQFMHRKRVALWGHGANLQGRADSLRERFKRRVARKADWWLAYTDMSVPLIERTGFPAARITVLNNAIDTTELRGLRDAVTVERTAALRAQLKLQGAHIGIYVGSLYAEKRIDFTLAAAAQIRKRIHDFEFVIVGGGPLQAEVTRFCEQHSWAKYVGVQKGQQKAALLALATVMLNPGLVGLGILDSFVCGVPIFTTNCGLHSPEIAYLADGINGRMTADSLSAYVDSVVEALSNESILETLRRGSEAAGKEYTIERMAARFTAGVLACLGAGPSVSVGSC